MSNLQSASYTYAKVYAEFATESVISWRALAALYQLSFVPLSV